MKHRRPIPDSDSRGLPLYGCGSPNKAMEPTEQGGCGQGIFQAKQKRLAMYRRWLGTGAACTDILPPRLIAGR